MENKFLMPYSDLSFGNLITLDKAEGPYVYDVDGKQYIQAMSGVTCATLGFSEKRLAQAAYDQFQKLPYYASFGNISHPNASTLAKKLSDISPVDNGLVFSNCSGSEANETAIKITWLYNNHCGRPKKKKIMAHVSGYHGSTIFSGSLTGLAYAHKGFDLPVGDRILHVDCPYYDRFKLNGENEEEFSQRLVDKIEKKIIEEGADQVAAFITEPVLGVGGFIIPPISYFAKLQQVLKKYEILLIVDEVVTGFGRTGNWFGSQTFKLQPDIITVAKALSAAYLPISATIVSEKFKDSLESLNKEIGLFAHGFTYSAHPVCSAVALKAIEIYEEEKLIERVRYLSPFLLGGLKDLESHWLVKNIRGIGLLAAVEINFEVIDLSNISSMVLMGRLAYMMSEEGLIARPETTSMLFAPPFISDVSLIEKIVKIFTSSLNKLAVYMKENNLLLAEKECV